MLVAESITVLYYSKGEGEGDVALVQLHKSLETISRLQFACFCLQIDMSVARCRAILGTVCIVCVLERAVTWIQHYIFFSLSQATYDEGRHKHVGCSHTLAACRCPEKAGLLSFR